MRLIERKQYLNKLINTIDSGDIKIITGIRRSGKSKLLEFFEKYLTDNKPKANIIKINLTSLEFESLLEYHALEEYVSKHFCPNVENFVLIDEVQMCPNFEKAINSLHQSEKYKLYLTGSNAFLLSSDLATLFTGRVFEIKIYPFSFQEFLQYFEYADPKAAFDKYVLEGGMSGSYVYPTKTEKYNYLTEVYDALILKDIVQRYNIQNFDLINALSDFLMDNISNPTSYRNIAKLLSNKTSDVNDKTVASYLKYLQEAFAFYRIRRYNIQGKHYLNSQDKYYLADHAFRYAKLGTKNMNYGRTYENIVAIELLRRGYDVYTGTLYHTEIDFVAENQTERLYIQVSDDISKDETLDRELRPLLKIRNAYPKLVLARTRHDEYQIEGVRVLDLADWLKDAPLGD